MQVPGPAVKSVCRAAVTIGANHNSTVVDANYLCADRPRNDDAHELTAGLAQKADQRRGCIRVVADELSWVIDAPDDDGYARRTGQFEADRRPAAGNDEAKLIGIEVHNGVGTGHIAKVVDPAQSRSNGTGKNHRLKFSVDEQEAMAHIGAVKAGNHAFVIDRP